MAANEHLWQQPKTQWHLESMSVKTVNKIFTVIMGSVLAFMKAAHMVNLIQFGVTVCTAYIHWITVNFMLVGLFCPSGNILGIQPVPSNKIG